MIEQYWKQHVGGRLQYTRVTVHDGQEQPLPYGATRLTRAAYEAEIGRHPEYDEQPTNHDPSMVRARTLDVEAIGSARAELAALGLTPATIDALLAGVTGA